MAAPAVAAPVSTTPNATPTFNGTVRGIVYSQSVAYVAGDFTAAYWAGATYSRGRIAAFSISTGALLPFNPGVDATVHGLALSGTTLFAVGEFALAAGVPRRHLAAFDTVTGGLRATFAQPVNGVPLAAAAGNGRLYIGGTVTSVGGVTRKNVAAFLLSTGLLDPAWVPNPERRVESIAYAGTRVYLGGEFSDVNGVAKTQKIAAVNATSGAVDTGFKSEVNRVVHTVTVAGNTVYAATGGQGGQAYAISTVGAVKWTLTTDGDVQAVTVRDDVVYWGGHFDHTCSTNRTGDHGVCLDGSLSRIKLAATSLTGTVISWAPNANGIHGVMALATSLLWGKVAAGGEFTAIGGVTQRRFAQFG